MTQQHLQSSLAAATHSPSPAASQAAAKNGLPYAFAARLRLLQADLAEEPAEVRQQLLSEELEAALTQINPGERLAFLKSLEDLFPVMETSLDRETATAVRQSTSDNGQKDLRDPEALTDLLIGLCAKLPEARRRTLIKRLSDGGLGGAAAGGQGDWSPAAAKLFSESLKLSPNAAIDPTRLMEIAALMAHFVISLDQPLWRIWKEIAPKSALRRPGDLAKTLAGYAAADEQVSRPQVQQELEALRRLIASVVQSVGQVGRSLGQGFRKFAPAEIEAGARNEKRMMESLEAVCWRKYLEIVSQLDEAAIDANVRQIIATHAESFLGHRK